MRAITKVSGHTFKVSFQLGEKKVQEAGLVVVERLGGHSAIHCKI